MSVELSENEIKELQRAFIDLMNYESDDPTDPIDPVIYKEPDGDNCLHIAAHRGDVRSVELLLKAGLDVNSIGEMGCTSLHYANIQGHNDVIQLLIKSGASTEIVNRFGKLPME